MEEKKYSEDRVRIKLCGLSRPEDIAAANALLPDLIGFVFAKKSRRYVTPERAAELKALLDPRIRAVGVFVNEDPEEIRKIAAAGSIDLVQLHGKETPEQVREVQEKLRELAVPAREADRQTRDEEKTETRQISLPVIQAFSVKTKEDLQAAAESPADFVLLDNGAGGTGTAFDWGILGAGSGGNPDGSTEADPDGKIQAFPRPYFLAGGLTPENVGTAIRQCRPWAVDTSSALETDGKKDPEKMRAFVNAVRCT